jgi:hypothetical protein
VIAIVLAVESFEAATAELKTTHEERDLTYDAMPTR